ncbi:MAG: cupin domain-containing protein [Chloroflexi bacterium]|nr:cupin domain-containing protein [Chloroflexota bacterium]
MAATERSRVGGRDQSGPDSYEQIVKSATDLRDRALAGRIVVGAEDQTWEQGRQGRAKFFLCREAPTNSVLHDWVVFVHDIRTHSGEHRHQGGLVIYVLEGEGFTEVGGEKFEWEAGDLLLLPIKVNGVVHKHYNKRPGDNCKWMAFIYRPLGDAIGFFLEHKANSPDYK